MKVLNVSARTLKRNYAEIIKSIQIGIIQKCNNYNKNGVIFGLSGGIDSASIVSMMKKHYSENLVKHTDFYPYGREILEHFKNKKQAICSNKPENFVRRILESLDGLQHFQAIVGGDSLKTKKPHPEGLDLILKKLKVSPDEAVLIGDSRVDIETGRRAGVYTCVVNYGLGLPEEITAASPDCSVDCLSKLKGMFS